MDYILVDLGAVMKHAAQPSPTSVRLSDDTRKILDEAARLTRRSRSYLVEETLKQFLPRIVQKETRPAAEERIRRLKELQGIGARLLGPKTIEEIDANIRQIRGDD
ncbi:ribbon-helix-helix protein, CopG family [Methylocystis heyeri]|uniref:Ribbon-helix-helix protein, CopG family n=1 Tax=Methylocystis heyeri TaxID=391905 RepID=A0A6B8KDB1_9HYPH|nr:ribbon-helix-helix protein, CopG family [Methylocystis heyeri]QGM45689.1 ribbon-helix-helix protein, CopG family [Methylocystis heyeri]